jgi:hypothetical protein
VDQLPHRHDAYWMKLVDWDAGLIVPIARVHADKQTDLDEAQVLEAKTLMRELDEPGLRHP